MAGMAVILFLSAICVAAPGGDGPQPFTYELQVDTGVASDLFGGLANFSPGFPIVFDPGVVGGFNTDGIRAAKSGEPIKGRITGFSVDDKAEIVTLKISSIGPGVVTIPFPPGGPVPRPTDTVYVSNEIETHYTTTAPDPDAIPAGTIVKQIEGNQFLVVACEAPINALFGPNGLTTGGNGGNNNLFAGTGFGTGFLGGNNILHAGVGKDGASNGANISEGDLIVEQGFHLFAENISGVKTINGVIYPPPGSGQFTFPLVSNGNQVGLAISPNGGLGVGSAGLELILPLANVLSDLPLMGDVAGTLANNFIKSLGGVPVDLNPTSAAPGFVLGVKASGSIGAFPPPKAPIFGGKAPAGSTLDATSPATFTVTFTTPAPNDPVINADADFACFGATNATVTMTIKVDGNVVFSQQTTALPSGAPGVLSKTRNITVAQAGAHTASETISTNSASGCVLNDAGLVIH